MASKGKKAAADLTTQLWNAVRGCDIMKADSILDSNTRTSEEGGGNVSVHSAGKIDFDKKVAGKNILMELASRKCEYEEDNDEEVDEDLYGTTFQEVIQNIIIYGGRDLAQDTVGGKNAFELAYESGNFYVVKALCDEDDMEINPTYISPDKVIAGYNFQLKLPPGSSRKMNGAQMSWFSMLKGQAEKRIAKVARPDPIRNRLVEAGYKRGSAEYFEMYELEKEHEREMAEAEGGAEAEVAAAAAPSKPKLIVKGPKQIAAERAAAAAAAAPTKSLVVKPAAAAAVPSQRVVLKSTGRAASPYPRGAPPPNSNNEKAVANAPAKASAAAGGASAAALLAASMPEIPKAQLQVMTVKQLAAAKARSLLAKMQAEKQDVLFLKYIAEGKYDKALEIAPNINLKVDDESGTPVILAMAYKKPTDKVDAYKKLVGVFLEKEPQYVYETTIKMNNDDNNAFYTAFYKKNAPFLAAYISALKELPENEHRTLMKQEVVDAVEVVEESNHPNIVLGANIVAALANGKNLKGGRRTRRHRSKRKTVRR